MRWRWDTTDPQTGTGQAVMSHPCCVHVLDVRCVFSFHVSQKLCSTVNTFCFFCYHAVCLTLRSIRVYQSVIIGHWGWKCLQQSSGSKYLPSAFSLDYWLRFCLLNAQRPNLLEQTLFMLPPALLLNFTLSPFSPMEPVECCSAFQGKYLHELKKVQGLLN